MGSRIAYPNMALLYLHPKFLTVFAAVPIDDENSRIYLRSAQGFVRWPIIGWLFSQIKHWADMGALWQDKKPLFSVRPIRTEDAKGEVLMEFDPHVVEYRKMRQSKLQAIRAQAERKQARPEQHRPLTRLPQRQEVALSMRSQKRLPKYVRNPPPLAPPGTDEALFAV